MFKDGDPIGPTEEDLKNEQIRKTVEDILYHKRLGLLKKLAASRRREITMVFVDLAGEIGKSIENLGGTREARDLGLLMDLGMDSEDAETPYYRTSAALAEIGTSKSNISREVSSFIIKYFRMGALGILTVNQFESYQKITRRNTQKIRPGKQSQAPTRSGVL